LYIVRSKWGVYEGGDSDTTGDDEVVGELAAEVATTGGGSDSINDANATMGEGKPLRNIPTGRSYKLRAIIGR
jgi:hypothetical protein